MVLKTYYLKSLLFLIACCAVEMGGARVLLSLHPHQVRSALALILLAGIAFLVGMWLGGLLKFRLGGWAAILLSTATFVTAALAMFIRHRCSESVLFDDLAWPRPLPYPDEALAALNDWFDSLYPIEGDAVKLHGELPKVRAVLDCVVSLVLVASGFVRRCIWNKKQATEASRSS